MRINSSVITVKFFDSAFYNLYVVKKETSSAKDSPIIGAFFYPKCWMKMLYLYLDILVARNNELFLRSDDL